MRTRRRSPLCHGNKLYFRFCSAFVRRFPPHTLFCTKNRSKTREKLCRFLRAPTRLQRSSRRRRCRRHLARALRSSVRRRRQPPPPPPPSPSRSRRVRWRRCTYRRQARAPSVVRLENMPSSLERRERRDEGDDDKIGCKSSFIRVHSNRRL